MAQNKKIILLTDQLFSYKKLFIKVLKNLENPEKFRDRKIIYEKLKVFYHLNLFSVFARVLVANAFGLVR